MLVLDENLPAEQRLLQRKWRIRFRAVGKEIGFSGTKDENLIPFLHRLPYPTFFSLDRDFHRRDLAHPPRHSGYSADFVTASPRRWRVGDHVSTWASFWTA